MKATSSDEDATSTAASWASCPTARRDGTNVAELDAGERVVAEVDDVAQHLDEIAGDQRRARREDEVAGDVALGGEQLGAVVARPLQPDLPE